MTYTKQFRVAELLYCPSDHTHHIFLCSMWGEYWKVAVDKLENGNFSTAWAKGMLLELPLKLVTEGGSKGDRSMIPDFSAFGEEVAVQMELLDPYATVFHTWGREIADRYLPPDTPPDRIPHDLHEPNIVHKRRKSNISNQDSVTETPPDRDTSSGQQTLFD